MFWVWSIQQNILFTVLVKCHFLYLKLLISQSKFVGPLEFEITRVACIFKLFPFIIYMPKNIPIYMSRLMTKPTKWPLRPAKIQISLGIHPVWPVFAVHMKKHTVLCYPLSALWRLIRLIRLGGCPGWSESSQAQISFCYFCHEAARLLLAIFWHAHTGLWECIFLDYIILPILSHKFVVNYAKKKNWIGILQGRGGDIHDHKLWILAKMLAWFKSLDLI